MSSFAKRNDENLQQQHPALSRTILHPQGANDALAALRSGHMPNCLSIHERMWGNPRVAELLSEYSLQHPELVIEVKVRVRACGLSSQIWPDRTCAKAKDMARNHETWHHWTTAFPNLNMGMYLTMCNVSDALTIARLLAPR